MGEPHRLFGIWVGRCRGCRRVVSFVSASCRSREELLPILGEWTFQGQDVEWTESGRVEAEGCTCEQ